MAIQSFNDTTPVGGAPAKSGGRSLAAPAPTNPVATGRPRLEQQTDGTANPRADTVTKGPATYGPTGKGQQAWPSKVNHYEEGEV